MIEYQCILIGNIWQPNFPICSYPFTVHAESDEDAIELAWEGTSDFSYIYDVYVTVGTCQHESRLVKGWDFEVNEDYYQATIVENDEEGEGLP